ncbi:MAG: TetR/AcrR family transcriptional regulator [Polaromonas sp.]|uniref:TetR/AcrR family transcriptional regulator n=1 Tax=Polaromonas sp. TaxID=1869339 RepID=UPI0017D95BB4|nr:TetR/AcrR family transcriptional regulator [Polaromonas sp.]NMM09588.1 TetR/AcrR family transcriptional regulator [Polaromonas sp.]
MRHQTNTIPPGQAIPSPAQLARGRQKAATQSSREKRERILKVAERLFHEQGYADTTMAQIVRELGMTKPYVYYYFQNKQEIFERLAWRPTVACFTVLDFVPEDQRPAHIKLASGLESLIRATIEHYPSAFFAYRDPQVFRPEFAAAQKKIANHFYERLCVLMEQAHRDGTLDFNETKITALAACSLPGFLYSWYRPDGRLGAEAMVKVLTELTWRVIGLRERPDAGFA